MPCFQCQKTTHLSTCLQCRQSFCQEHTLEHREYLFHQMEQIEKEFFIFNQRLESDEFIQPSLSRVDRWEKETIEKIQNVAKQARDDLRHISQRLINQVKQPFQILQDEVESHHQSQNYPEEKFSEWMNTLKEYQNILRNSFDTELVRYDSVSIPSIRIHDKGNLCLAEKFQKSLDSIIVSSDQRTVTCKKSNWNGSTVRGYQKYSSGVHSIHFEVKEKGKHDLFFGITSAAKDPNPWNRRTPPFAYGWWEFPAIEGDSGSMIQSYVSAGDRLTLTLDCDNRHIQLKHHRTDQILDQPVSYEQCPFPWKMALVLYSPKDSVCILP